MLLLRLESSGKLVRIEPLIKYTSRISTEKATSNPLSTCSEVICSATEGTEPYWGEKGDGTPCSLWTISDKIHFVLPQSQQQEFCSVRNKCILCVFQACPLSSDVGMVEMECGLFSAVAPPLWNSLTSRICLTPTPSIDWGRTFHMQKIFLATVFFWGGDLDFIFNDFLLFSLKQQ